MKDFQIFLMVKKILIGGIGCDIEIDYVIFWICPSKYIARPLHRTRG